MKKPMQPYSMFAKQGHIAARADMRLGGLCLLATVVSLFMWGPGWNVWIPLGLGILMIVSWWTESLFARANERVAATKRRAPRDVGTSLDSEPRPCTDFSLVQQEDGDEWYECATGQAGRGMRIRISTTSRVYKACLPYARSLVARPAELVDALEAFKRRQAELRPTWAEEIRALEIEIMAFYNSKRPNVAEVYFTEESGGESWSCVFDGTEFRDLTQNN